jgi:hypothetical protein
MLCHCVQVQLYKFALSVHSSGVVLEKFEGAPPEIGSQKDSS